MKLKKYNQFNESVRDKMTPKSEEEIIAAVGNLSPVKKLLKGLELGYPWLVKQGIDDAMEHRERIVNESHLAKAILNGDMNVIRMMVEAGIQGINSQYIVRCLCDKGNVEMTKYLLANGINAEKTGAAYFYRLIKKANNPTIVKMFLEVSPTLKKKLENKVKVLEKDLDQLKQYV